MAPRSSERLAVQKAIAESATDYSQTSTASDTEFFVPTATEIAPNAQLGSIAMGTPGNTDEVKPENIQPTRINPKRRAATRVAGSYALEEDPIMEGDKAQNSAGAPLPGPTKRKRRETFRKTAPDIEEREIDEELADGQEAAAATLKKQNAVVSSQVKNATKRTRSFKAGKELSDVTVQVVDNDEKDEDFNPGTRTSSAKKGNSMPKQYGLRQQRGAGLLVKHVKEETTKTSSRFMSEPGNTAVTKTSKKIVKKETRTKMTGPSTRAKQAVKQRRVTSAKASLSTVLSPSSQLTKKKKPVRMIGKFTNQYKIRFGYTPFPKNHRPTAKSCHTVFNILKKHHERDNIRLDQYPSDRDSILDSDVEGPMHAGQEVTFNAIVKTILSQATNNDNAQTVEQSLINRFRYDFLGAKLKGETPNYHAMRKASESVVAKALASGGLHNIKSKQIKGCLDHVYNMNMECATAEQRLAAEQMRESIDFIPGMLSLDYMMSMSLQEKFDHLVSMPGIGVKTAACILSFNFEYPLFAVDTHVMRISRLLRWLPLNASSENHAFMHLDKKVPDELKYGLHQAFWHHGQICVRCKAGSNPKTKGWNETICPIEHLVDRSRKDVRKAKDSNSSKDETVKKPIKVKVKKQPTVYPYHKFTPERAAKLGYELRKINIDDGFGVRRSNYKAKPLYKWVLKSDHETFEHTTAATAEDAEDIEDEVKDTDDPDDDMVDGEVDDVPAETDGGDDDDDDNAVSDSEISELPEDEDEDDEDDETEEASDEEQT